MLFEIKSWINGKVIHRIEAGTLKSAVELLAGRGADLGDADLRDANLIGANLRGANLRDANFRGANLRDADLRGANFRDADLRDADLGGANFRDADLGGANFRDADLRGADLGGANFRDANLRDADLRDADLRDADLRDADLRDADLRGANFRDARHLSEAKNLRLPTGETWEEYLTETVPALLTAGGKPLESFAASWECHDWTNCPMAHAFDVHELRDVPILLRPRAEQFVQFFDSGNIPWPLPQKKDAE